jgi:hypothetical protein
MTHTVQTYRDRVAAYFKAKPGQWIEWHELAAIGGAMAWRTRVSDCRQPFEKGGLEMDIVNKVHKLPDGTKVSAYMYRPKAKAEAA